MADWGSLSGWQTPYTYTDAGSPMMKSGVDDMQHPAATLSKDQLKSIVGNLGLTNDYLSKVQFDQGGQADGFWGGGDGNSYFPGGQIDQPLRSQYLTSSKGESGDTANYDDVQRALRLYGLPDTWQPDAPPPAAAPPTTKPPVATPNFTHLNGIPSLNSISQSPVFGSTVPNGVLDSAAGTYHSSFGALAGTGGANPQTPGNGGVPGTVDWSKWMMGNTPNGPQQF